MSIVDRAKNICLTPNTEWPVIAGETTQTGSLITGYVLPLAAIGAVAGFIGQSIIGLPFVGRVSMAAGLTGAVLAVVMAVVGCLIVGFVINALAPTFGGQKDQTQALKVAVYSYTPAWIMAVLNILPMLGILAILGGLYGIYLLYLGLPKLMKCPEDKAIGYTAVTVICAIVISIVLGMVTMLFVGAGAMGAGLMGRGADVEFSADSPMGQLQALGKAMEESAAKMEEAQKSEDVRARDVRGPATYRQQRGEDGHGDADDVQGRSHVQRRRRAERGARDRGQRRCERPGRPGELDGHPRRAGGLERFGAHL
jgi:hypothetical protein